MIAFIYRGAALAPLVGVFATASVAAATPISTSCQIDVQGANDLCLSPRAAFPGTLSKSRCDVIIITDISIPETLEAAKDLGPDNDPHLFDRDIDAGTAEASDGDGGITGKKDVI